MSWRRCRNFRRRSFWIVSWTIYLWLLFLKMKVPRNWETLNQSFCWDPCIKFLQRSWLTGWGKYQRGISEYQNNFVKGHPILNCSLIANELLDSRIKEGSGGRIFRVDMMKAYDLVSWNFLYFVLQEMGSGERWRKWVRTCISHARFLVMENGLPKVYFITSRG